MHTLIFPLILSRLGRFVSSCSATGAKAEWGGGGGGEREESAVMFPLRSGELRPVTSVKENIFMHCSHILLFSNNCLLHSWRLHSV